MLPTSRGSNVRATPRWELLACLALGAGCSPAPKTHAGADSDTGAPCTPTLWYNDSDADTYGDPADTSLSCEHPQGYVANGEDCAPREPTIHPGAPEYCNDIDEDCDGDLVEAGAVDCVTWYADIDGDGYGGRIQSDCQCASSVDFPSPAARDCDDGDPTIHPHAEDTCGDTVDSDCEGTLRCVLLLQDVELVGEAPGDLAGSAVAVVGDQTGDGIPDLLVGAESAHTLLGAAYVVSGATSTRTNLRAATATLIGAAERDEVGVALAGGGDVDGDGVADLLVGAPGVAAHSVGVVYVVAGGHAGELSLVDAEATITRAAYPAKIGRPGTLWVSPDLSGDLLADVVISDQLDASDAGRVFVSTTPLTGPMDAGELGISITGATPHEHLGTSVLGGDLDGDGLADLAIGATDAGPDGVVYLFQGPLTGAMSTTDADVVLAADVEGAQAGEALSLAGDGDQDGRPDLLICGLGDGGDVWLVTSGLSGSIGLSAARTRFEGEGGGFGRAVAGGADLNGSGTPDVAISANTALVDRGISGMTAVFVDPPPGVYGTSDASALLTGAQAYSDAGKSIVGSPDLDGDGCDELLIGADFLDSRGEASGSAFLVSGCGLW